MKTSSFILAAPPQSSREAGAYGCRVAQLAYGINSMGQLMRHGVPFVKKGCLMAICHDGSPLPDIDSGKFLTQLLREFSTRGYSGIIADFEGSPTQSAADLLAYLSAELEKHKFTFYAPEAYGDIVGKATRIIISSAISGGTFTQRVRDAGERFGFDRLTLEAERNCEDFILPSPDGSGTRLSLAELDQLFLDYLPTPFFSPELCTYYFTYRDSQKQSHFVLFDNSSSMKKKISMAENLGIGEAILLYPEINDIARDILY